MFRLLRNGTGEIKAYSNKSPSNTPKKERKNWLWLSTRSYPNGSLCFSARLILFINLKKSHENYCSTECLLPLIYFFSELLQIFNRIRFYHRQQRTLGNLRLLLRNSVNFKEPLIILRI